MVMEALTTVNFPKKFNVFPLILSRIKPETLILFNLIQSLLTNKNIHYEHLYRLR